METKEHYYKRIEPADAHVLQKTLKLNTSNSTPNAVTQNSQHVVQVNGHDKNAASNHHYHNHGKAKA